MNFWVGYDFRTWLDVGRVTEERGSKSYTLSWVALDKRVLIVEVRSTGTNHGAFIGAVEGADYGTEALDVVGNGSVVNELGHIYFKGFGSGPVKPIREAESLFESGLKTDPRLVDPRILEVRPIDKHVLLVAIKGRGNTWKAFIGAVKGEDYGVEALEVIKNGSEVPFELAEECFQDLGKATFGGFMKWHKQLRVYLDDEDFGPAEDWGNEKPLPPKH